MAVGPPKGFRKQMGESYTPPKIETNEPELGPPQELLDEIAGESSPENTTILTEPELGPPKEIQETEEFKRAQPIGESYESDKAFDRNEPELGPPKGLKALMVRSENQSGGVALGGGRLKQQTRKHMSTGNISGTILSPNPKKVVA